MSVIALTARLAHCAETLNNHMDYSCEWLQSALTGEVEYLRDLEEARQHWRECLECQETVPDAIAQLDSIEQHLVRNASSNIERIYHQYQSDVALAECAKIEEWQRRSSRPATLRRLGETEPSSPYQ